MERIRQKHHISLTNRSDFDLAVEPKLIKIVAVLAAIDD